MKLRLGMIVTDARGKAGGQYIRKFGSIHVMQNITVPTVRMAGMQNAQRLLNAWLFSLWASLASAQKDAWGVVASNISAVNVFGDSRTVSAREIFNRCNMIVYPFNKTMIDPLLFNYVVPLNAVTAFATNVNLEEFQVFLNESTGWEFAEIRAKRIRYYSERVRIGQMKVFARTSTPEDANNNYELFLASFPRVQIGEYFSVAIRFVNASGIASPYFQLPVRID